MLELHQILEDRITKNAARMLRLARRKRSTGLVKVYCNQSGIAGVTALLSNLHEDGGELALLKLAQCMRTLYVECVLTCTLCACSKKCTTTLHLLQAIFHFGPEVRSSTRTPLSHSTHCPMPKELSECWQEGWVHSLHPMPAEGENQSHGKYTTMPVNGWRHSGPDVR